MASTVALTGATGFIGRAIAARLRAKGWPVVALARREDRALAQAGVRLSPGSLEDRESLDRLVREAGVVVHCAGVVAAADDRIFEAVNADGTARLAAAAAGVPGRPRMLLVSSLAAREPGLSAYGASKCHGEEAFAREAAALERCVVRPPGVYGPGDRATLPLFQQLDRGFLLAPANPAARFSLLQVEDLAGAIERLLETPRWDNAVLELDDGREGGYGWADLAEAAGRHLGRRVRRVSVPLWPLWLPAEVNRRVAKALGRAPFFSPGKLRELFHPDWVARCAPGGPLADWRADYTFETGFPVTLDWYRAEGWIKERNRTMGREGAQPRASR
jgi:nucleoside-diphosphate-sugar epimerase